MGELLVRCPPAEFPRSVAFSALSTDLPPAPSRSSTLPLLSVVSLALALAATAAGVVLFGRGVYVLVRNMSVGRPAPDRTGQPARRVWLSLAQAVGHQAFRGRPLIRAAHWLVMVSFPVLVLTLLGSYGQLVSPTFHLPLVGQWPGFTWLVEFFAWGGTLGIVALMVVRTMMH